MYCEKHYTNKTDFKVKILTTHQKTVSEILKRFSKQYSIQNRSFTVIMIQSNILKHMSFDLLKQL